MHEVRFIIEYGEWYMTLKQKEKESIDRIVGLLKLAPVSLQYPHSSSDTNDNRIRELRAQSQTYPMRAIYALDPRSDAVLLTGFSKKDGGGKGSRAASIYHNKMFVKGRRLFTDYLFQLADGKNTSKPIDALYTLVPTVAGPVDDLAAEVVRATGWTRREVLQLMKPGNVLDPDTRDGEHRILKLITKDGGVGGWFTRRRRRL